MPLNPTFSVTPVKPYVESLDPTTGLVNYWAALQCFGGYLCWHPTLGQRLSDQNYQDKAVFGYTDHLPVPAPATIYETPRWYRTYPVAIFSVKTNATTENQYLLIFHVASQYARSTRAVFYVNGNLVKEEDILGEEHVAILVDCPSPQTPTVIYMFLGADFTLELKGVECYIL